VRISAGAALPELLGDELAEDRQVVAVVLRHDVEVLGLGASRVSGWTSSSASIST
jgi:hypothetical protein